MRAICLGVEISRVTRWNQVFFALADSLREDKGNTEAFFTHRAEVRKCALQGSESFELRQQEELPAFRMQRGRGRRDRHQVATLHTLQGNNAFSKALN